VKRRPVLGSGVILSGATAVYDLVREQIYAATDCSPLVIPEEAVVVPGSTRNFATCRAALGFIFLLPHYC
jgi:hypothetical protein